MVRATLWTTNGRFGMTGAADCAPGDRIMLIFVADSAVGRADGQLGPIKAHIMLPSLALNTRSVTPLRILVAHVTKPLALS
jgi:hypothetical protein